MARPRSTVPPPFWFGEKLTTDDANYNGNYPYNNGQKGGYRERTMPVRSFARNPWGLYQMHGNVWEWCQDMWHDSYEGASEDGSTWATTGSTSLAVGRGGSWLNNGTRLSSSTFKS